MNCEKGLKRQQIHAAFCLGIIPILGGRGGPCRPNGSDQAQGFHPPTHPPAHCICITRSTPSTRSGDATVGAHSSCPYLAGLQVRNSPGLTWPSPVQLDLGRCQQGADHVCNVAEGGGSQQGGRADHAKHHVQGGGHQAEQQGQEVGALRGRGVKGVGVGVGVGGSGVVACGWRAGVPSQAAEKRRDKRGEVR